jgi:hypothetical protein
MCAACGAGETNCPTCRALKPASAFPFDEQATLDQLMNHAVTSLQREWQACIVAAAIALGLYAAGVFLIVTATSLASMVLLRSGELGTRAPTIMWAGMQFLRQMAIVPLQSLLMLGLSRTMIDVLMGRRPAASRFFSDLRLLPNAVLIQLPLAFALAAPGIGMALLPTELPVATIFSTGWTCLVLPVLAFVGMSWWLFSIPELVISDCGAVEAMRRAFSLGRNGRNLRVFGYAALAAVSVMAGTIACGVGLLVGIPFAMLLMMSLFLALRKSASLPTAKSL